MADDHTEQARRFDVRVLVLSASLRRSSLNARLASLTGRCIEANGGSVVVRCMADFEMPHYDQDVQDQEGFPAGADALRLALEANDAFVIVAPEYNASMPGSLKNAIDWLSRFRPQPFSERQSLLLSASPSMAGGNRGLWSGDLARAPRKSGLTRICSPLLRRTKHSMMTADFSTGSFTPD